MESLLPYGNNQNGRIMKKQVREELILKSFQKSHKALKKAQEVAEYNNDIEALVIIAERWLQFSQQLKSLDKTQHQMLGFTSVPMEEDDE